MIAISCQAQSLSEGLAHIRRSLLPATEIHQERELHVPSFDTGHLWTVPQRNGPKEKVLMYLYANLGKTEKCLGKAEGNPRKTQTN